MSPSVLYSDEHLVAVDLTGDPAAEGLVHPLRQLALERGRHLGGPDELRGVPGEERGRGDVAGAAEVSE